MKFDYAYFYIFNTSLIIMHILNANINAYIKESGIKLIINIFTYPKIYSNNNNLFLNRNYLKKNLKR